MKDMLTIEMQSLRIKMRDRLDSDPTLSDTYRRAIMKMLENTISEIEQEQETVQRISL